MHYNILLTKKKSKLFVFNPKAKAKFKILAKKSFISIELELNNQIMHIFLLFWIPKKIMKPKIMKFIDILSSFLIKNWQITTSNWVIEKINQQLKNIFHSTNIIVYCVTVSSDALNSSLNSTIRLYLKSRENTSSNL